jgi:hypothetical protein
VFFRVLLVGFGLFRPGAVRAPKKVSPLGFYRYIRIPLLLGNLFFKLIVEKS